MHVWLTLTRVEHLTCSYFLLSSWSRFVSDPIEASEGSIIGTLLYILYQADIDTISEKIPAPIDGAVVEYLKIHGRTPDLMSMKL